MKHSNIPNNFAITSILETKPNPELHVAIIMDGNGRWATHRGLPRPAGHAAGVKALRSVTAAAPALRISTLTVYAFSSDNWRRPQAEVSALMGLLQTYLKKDVCNLVRQGVRLQVIGRRDRLPPGVCAAIGKAETATKSGTRLLLRVAIDYSSRDAILAAATAFSSACTEGKTPGASSHVFARHLSGPDAPRDVDLLIRTGGEKRLSDFLLWEAAYAELYFTDTHWPDFDGGGLARAIEEFRMRDRRFGGLPEQSRSIEARKPGARLQLVKADEQDGMAPVRGAS